MTITSKVDRKNRTFTESWTEQYFLHYTTKHSDKFDSIIGEERINSLRGSLQAFHESIIR